MSSPTPPTTPATSGSGVPFGPVDRDSATAAFFDAAARGELVVRCCPDGHLSPPEALSCVECRAESLEWSAPLSGDATLVSWIVTPGKTAKDGTSTPDRVAAIAELAEGPWLTTGMLCDDPASLRAGRALRVVFIQPEDSEPYPVVQPV